MKRLLITAVAPVALLTGCFDQSRELDEQRKTVDELRKDFRKLEKAQKAKSDLPPASPTLTAPPSPRLGPGDLEVPPPLPPRPYPYGPGDL